MSPPQYVQCRHRTPRVLLLSGGGHGRRNISPRPGQDKCLDIYRAEGSGIQVLLCKFALLPSSPSRARIDVRFSFRAGRYVTVVGDVAHRAYMLSLPGGREHPHHLRMAMIGAGPCSPTSHGDGGMERSCMTLAVGAILQRDARRRRCTTTKMLWCHNSAHSVSSSAS